MARSRKERKRMPRSRKEKVVIPVVSPLLAVKVPKSRKRKVKKTDTDSQKLLSIKLSKGYRSKSRSRRSRKMSKGYRSKSRSRRSRKMSKGYRSKSRSRRSRKMSKGYRSRKEKMVIPVVTPLLNGTMKKGRAPLPLAGVPVVSEILKPESERRRRKIKTCGGILIFRKGLLRRLRL